MLNKVILTGRMTAKPELKTTTSGISVTSFSLAVQRNFKNGNGEYEADFLNCVAWRNQAEFITKYFDKGQLITVVGSLTSRRYEDNSGNKRTAFEVVVDEAMFAESKAQGDNKTSNSNMQFEEIEEEGLPF